LENFSKIKMWWFINAKTKNYTMFIN
jgi:hypothetical protein